MSPQLKTKQGSVFSLLIIAESEGLATSGILRIFISICRIKYELRSKLIKLLSTLQAMDGNDIYFNQLFTHFRRDQFANFKMSMIFSKFKWSIPIRGFRILDLCMFEDDSTHLQMATSGS